MSNGLFDKHDMVKKIIALLDSVTVTGAKNVLVLGEVFKMLSSLQKGLKADEDAKNKVIEMLKDQLKRATEIIPEEGGFVVGGEHYDLKFGGADNGEN